MPAYGSFVLGKMVLLKVRLRDQKPQPKSFQPDAGHRLEQMLHTCHISVLPLGQANLKEGPLFIHA